MTSFQGMGDSAACDQAAVDCERASRQLDGPIQRLDAMRGQAGSAWSGTAGDSLVRAVNARADGLRAAQADLANAAGSLRAAAAQIRDAIRRAEQAKQHAKQVRRNGSNPISNLAG